MTALVDDPLVPVLARRTALFLQDAAALDEPGLRAPSLLPGWSRAHVVAHVARNADGFARLAATAATGVEQHMYPSRAARDAEIERDAAATGAALAADARAAADRLLAAMAAVPDGAVDQRVPTGLGPSFRVGDLPWMRLREVAYHHVDLAVGVAFEDLPAEVLRAGLAECAGRLEVGVSARCAFGDGEPLDLVLGDGATRVVGSAGSVLAWLTGRSTGAGVVTADGSGLPDVPAWG